MLFSPSFNATLTSPIQVLFFFTSSNFYFFTNIIHILEAHSFQLHDVFGVSSTISNYCILIPANDNCTLVTTCQCYIQLQKYGSTTRINDIDATDFIMLMCIEAKYVVVTTISFSFTISLQTHIYRFRCQKLILCEISFQSVTAV